MDGHDGSAPLEEGPSYVRFVCKITVQRASSRLGGRGDLADVESTGPVRVFEAKYPVDDPSDFLDYDRIRRIVWFVLIRMPGLRDVDLSPSNWDIFRPGAVATSILRIAQGNDDIGLCGGHYRFAVEMHVKVTLVFGEPRALLRYCGEEVMQVAAGDPCGICLGGGLTSPTLVNLPCGHAFHTLCILKSFFKDTACPLCRHDLRDLVAAPWATPNSS
ncbi:unnamed protein product [Urochloa decumbens]|uniref:RING-type domain-containing protein n=1 Tax=Urochloa decumbens TaxID=240449 RepID=A0ABC9FHB8_9POAL